MNNKAEMSVETSTSVDTVLAAVTDGLAVWVGAGGGWKGVVGRLGVLAGVEVGGGSGSAVRSGVGSDGFGEVDVTAELEVAMEVAKTGGGKKSARGGGVLR